MKGINFFQNVLITFGLLFLIALPLSTLFGPLTMETKSLLYRASFFVVFLVMVIRPLADIFMGTLWLRKLVIFRKGFGVLSASIIIGLALLAFVTPGSTYLASLISWDFFSFRNYAIFSHIGDVSGFILLITSNRLSQRLLKTYWKRIQRLSYVYFYTGAIFEAFFLGSTFALYALMVVTNVTMLAWGVKKWRRATRVSILPRALEEG